MHHKNIKSTIRKQLNLLMHYAQVETLLTAEIINP
jgi:hypothetical protein